MQTKLQELNPIMPDTLQAKLEMANVFVRSNLMPRGLDTPEKVVIALEMGHELGLPPLIAIMNIAVINNRPTLKADMMVALALRSGKIEDLRIQFSGNEHEDDDNFGCKVTIRRKGIATPFKVTFSRLDARIAGLIDKDNWQKYERRMLKHRAIAYCIRDALPEIFAGIYLPDEIENIATEQTGTTQIFKPDITAENTEVITNDKPQPEELPSPITNSQIKALKMLSERIFSEGIINSYVYDKYHVGKLEELSQKDAGELILVLQNEPGKIQQWIEETYDNAA